MQTHDRDDYIRRLELQRVAIRRRTSRYRGVAAVLFAVPLLLTAVIQYRILLPITPPVASYLVNTLPPRFSREQLALLLRTTGADENLLDTLTWIYWSPAMILTVAALSIVASGLASRRQAPWQRRFLELLDAKAAVLAVIDAPSRWRRIRLARAVLGTTAFDRIVPVRRRWFTNPETQWFTSLYLAKEIRPIISTIHQFPRTLLHGTQRSTDMRPFIGPLDQLINFYFAIACRRDPTLKGAHPVGAELDLLQRFAQLARPVIIANNPNLRGRTARRKSLPSRVYAVLSQPLVRDGGTVAAIAAGVMIVGVLVFKINAAQAFLTWFTVAFGTMTLSVGITSFRMARSGSTEDAGLKPRQRRPD